MAGRGPGIRARVLAGWLLGLVPAGVLLYAALLKGLDPGLFADQITAHKVTPASWSASLAHIFIAVEALLGCALLLRLWPRATHPAFIALMAGFIAVTAIAWAHGNTKECGCFGRAVGRSPLQVIVQDGILIALSAACIYLLNGVRTSRRAGIVWTAALVPSILAFSAFGARLPADAMVTGLQRGDSLADLPIEDLRRPHGEGWVLLALVDGTCSGCGDATPRLNQLAGERKDLNVAFVFSGTRQEAMAYRLAQLPAFQVAHASPRALRAYYRALPATFLLHDGRLVHAWWGVIPSPVEVIPLLPPVAGAS